MEIFNITAYLVGILKGVPTVGLSLLLAWVLVKWEFLLKEKGMDRLLRLIILLITGCITTFLIVAVSYPYGFSFHRIIFSLMIPFVFYGYVQILRYQLRKKGYRSGNCTINRSWLMGGIVVVLLMFGCYPSGAGNTPHILLAIGIGVSYIASFNYVIFFSNSDGFQDDSKFKMTEIIEDVIWLGIGSLLLWVAYTSIHEWEYFSFPISSETNIGLTHFNR